ncbi:hypothetical protein vseg_004471 [Gypsophila vaccaria]
MSTTTAADTATTTPLLPPPIDRRRSSARRSTTVRGAVSLLRRANSRQMISEQSVRVRESAAQQIEERQSDWAYSTPVVILDLIWNTMFVISTIVVIFISASENSLVPLRLWLAGYALQCAVHMSCVISEYRRRRSNDGGGGGGGGRVASSVGSSLGGSMNIEENTMSYPNSSSNFGSSASVDAGFVEYVSEVRQVEESTSVAKHLESANTMFSFIWWIIGFYWVSSGGEMLSDNAPKLYWLTITFLAFDVFFVVICVVVACVIGIAVCCCLPCIIAILYAVADQEGATKDDIEKLPKYKFRRLGEIEKPSGEIQESFGGIMTECDTDTPIERALSAEDAECVICLSAYDDGSEIRELPCRHHFHCGCIDKWLHMNATCPLCKYNILKNGSSEEV